MAIVTAQTQNWSKYLATFLILNTYNFIYQTKLPITSLKHKKTTGKGFPFSKLFLQLTWWPNKRLAQSWGEDVLPTPMTAGWLVWLSTTLSLTLWVIITSQARFGLFFFPSALPVSGFRRWAEPDVWEGLSRWTSAQFPNKSDGTVPESQVQTIPLVSLRQLISLSDQSWVFPKWLWERLLLTRTMSSVLSQVPNRRGPLAIPQMTGALPAIPWIIRSNSFRRDLHSVWSASNMP